MSPPADPVPPTRQGEQTRTKILEAAATLVECRPLHQISLLEICTASEVSAGSLHHFFPTKDDLGEALHSFVVERAFDLGCQRIDELAAADLDLDELIDRLLAELLAVYGPATRSVFFLEPTERSSQKLTRARARRGTELLDRITELVGSRLNGPGTDVISRRTRLLSHVVAATVGRMVVAPHLFNELQMSDAEFVAEVAKLAKAYLEYPETSRDRSSA